MTNTNIKDISTIVHFGAGKCEELSVYEKLKAKSILLVEANPARTAKLKSTLLKKKQFEIIQCAVVGGETGSQLFKLLNLQDASGMKEPSGLIDLYPNVRIEQDLEVELSLPQDLLSRIELNSESDNYLVIDTPGVELDILEELRQSNYLGFFCNIRLTCGMSSLYKNSAPAKEVLEFLKDNGYEITATDYNDDPDRPTWLMERDRKKIKFQELSNQLENAHQKISSLEIELSKCEALVDELKSKNENFQKEKNKADKLAADLKNELKGTNKKNKKKDKEASKKLADFENKLSNNQSEVQKLLKELSEANANKKEKIDLANKHLETINRLEGEREKLRIEVIEKDKVNLDLEGKVKDFSGRLKKLENEKQELIYRQSALDTEIVKAESQLDLIKDVVLREKEF